MCGICGVFSRTAERLTVSEESALLQRHRGPDHFGSSRGTTWAVFHNRLSVIDTSTASNQPLEDESHLLIYNGEIYNFESLAGEKLGHRDASSDVRTLFQLLKKFGSSILPELDGMFAFAWYDKERRTLLCARDRMGIKPLYWAIRAGAFFCTSELKSMLALLRDATDFDARAALDPRFIVDTFMLGCAESRETPFYGIHELAPGTELSYEIDTEHAEHHSYYDMSKHIGELLTHNGTLSGGGSPVEKLDSMLRESVRLHLRSDVPLGVLCSGGLDSSLISALSRRVSGAAAAPVLYHAGFNGTGDERQWAEKVARHLKLDLRFIAVDEAMFLGLLPLAVWHGDLPIYHANDLSFYAVANCARQDGIKVLLSGEGADELFGGYPWYRTLRNTQALYGPARTAGFFASLVRRFFRISPLGANFGRDAMVWFAPSHYLYADTAAADLARRCAIVNNGPITGKTMALLDAYGASTSHGALAALLGMNVYGHLTSLLRRNDRMGMMASIETRVPFLENAVIDFALALDTKWKIRGGCGKYLLKRVASRYLPRRVAYRKKQGFPVPWKEFLAAADRSLLRDGFFADFCGIAGDRLLNVLSESDSLLFSALSIEIWGRLFLHGETTDALAERLKGR